MKILFENLNGLAFSDVSNYKLICGIYSSDPNEDPEYVQLHPELDISDVK